MSSIFSKIISGEIPAHKIAENDNFLAFLDIQPLVEGHVLVVPKKEIDYIFDLDQETYAALLCFAKVVAAGIKKAIPCIKVGMAAVGLEVPHAHIHLIPINEVGDMNFNKQKLKLTNEQLSSTATKIKSTMMLQQKV